jgi:hypothetical protein
VSTRPDATTCNHAGCAEPSSLWDGGIPRHGSRPIRLTHRSARSRERRQVTRRDARDK